MTPMAFPPITGIKPGQVVMLPGWQVTLNNEIWGVWKDMTAEMKSLARRYVPQPPHSPYATGELKRSIHGRTYREGTAGHGKPVSTVWADADHAAFVEYGTGRRGALTNPEDTPPGYRHGPSRGMEAQPYLRPAMYDVLRRWFE